MWFYILMISLFVGFTISGEGVNNVADKYNIFGKSGRSGRIMRTVTFTVCEGYELNESNGKSREFKDTLVGKYTPKRATRAFNKISPGYHIKITHTIVYSQLVSMDFWDFWQYCEPRTDPKKLEEYILEKKVF